MKRGLKNVNQLFESKITNTRYYIHLHTHFTFIDKKILKCLLNAKRTKSKNTFFRWSAIAMLLGSCPPMLKITP